MTHAGGPGSNPSQAKRKIGHPGVSKVNAGSVTLKPLKLQQYTLHFWKPLIFFYLDKRGQERSCTFTYDMLLGIPIGLLHKIANVCNQAQVTVSEVKVYLVHQV